MERHICDKMPDGTYMSLWRGLWDLCTTVYGPTSITEDGVPHSATCDVCLRGISYCPYCGERLEE